MLESAFNPRVSLKHLALALALVVVAFGSACEAEYVSVNEIRALPAAGSVVNLVSVSANKCIDIPYGDPGDGVNVQIWSCNGLDPQAFELEPADDGYVALRNVATDKCVDVFGKSTKPGGNIGQWTCHGGWNQQWMLEEVEPGVAVIRSRHSGLLLDVSANQTADGTNIIQWSDHGQANQRFQVVPVDPVTEDTDTISACGTEVAFDESPFGCAFAWGANGNEDDRASYLQFMTVWVGYEPNGGLDGQCDGCSVVSQLAQTPALPVFYGYMIGFLANADGYGDCNLDFDENLCTHGAQWIRQNRQRVIDAYGNYARMAYETNPNKPVVWFLEGDFIQYTYDDQTQPLSMQELGELAMDITCAIKSNAPNAMVGINHSAWLSDEITNALWAAMPLDIVDFVWTTGVGNNDGYINGDANPGSYNAATARYDYLHALTGKGIVVDTSFGASQQSDSWTGIGTSELNHRIAEGVLAANVTQPPDNYQQVIESFNLNSTCF